MQSYGFDFEEAKKHVFNFISERSLIHLLYEEQTHIKTENLQEVFPGSDLLHFWLRLKINPTNINPQLKHKKYMGQRQI